MCKEVLLTAALVLAIPAYGQASGNSTPAAALPDLYHEADSADIIVTAPYRQDRFQSLSGMSVLQGDKLLQSLRPSLGDTLARSAGVSATSFGPTASRPILRGQQGERVQVLTDGIGAIDASSGSPDHAVAIDPLLADRIEILRGPEALLYGSSAISGVVNVIGRRIPRRIPDEPVHVQGLAGTGTAADEWSASAAADVAVSQRFVLHVDGSYLKSSDLKIGGFALSETVRAQALESSRLPVAQQVDDEGDPIDFAGTTALRGQLPNTSSRTWTAGVGATLVTETGNLGISYSHHNSLYGVPVRYAIRPSDAQEAARIDLVQDRFDARAGIQLDSGLLDSINGRFATASYRHHELEEDGDIGTTFTSKGLEGRLELVQASRGAWKGATGVQFVTRDFDVRGEEAFQPKNSTAQLGVFILQQLDYDRLKLQAAGRYERATVTARPRADEDFHAGQRIFDSFSASVGLSYAVFEGWRASINLARSSRAPAAEELFANGPHAGTQTTEIGNPDFQTERSWGVEAVLRGRGDGYHLEASIYSSWFADFIYQSNDGSIRDGLPVYRFQQGKARYYGFELQGMARLAEFGHTQLSIDALVDYTRANITAIEPAPRIPPLRLLAGISLHNPLADVRGEIEWVQQQNRLAAFETATAGYTLANIQLNIRPWGKERPLNLALSANNLFNANARRHASALKDFAPLSGRDIRLSAQFSF